MISPGRLWLPAHVMVRQPLAEVEKGRLALALAREPGSPPSLCLRFDCDGERCVYVLSSEDRREIGVAYNVASWPAQGYGLDLDFEIEGDPELAFGAWDATQAQYGQVALGPDGPALIARFRPVGGLSFGVPISLKTWTRAPAQDFHAVFARWRLRIDVAGRGPIEVGPFYPHRDRAQPALLGKSRAAKPTRSELVSRAGHRASVRWGLAAAREAFQRLPRVRPNVETLLAALLLAGVALGVLATFF